jgi:hypothetical protein
VKLSEAEAIINKREPGGFLVSFEHVQSGMLRSDHFPDVRAGEPAFRSEDAAWSIAKIFAANTRGRCVNIYVARSDFTPVEDYREKMIVNR